MRSETTSEQAKYLSTVQASRLERWIALAFAVASILIFIAIAPIAKQPLPQAASFIPAYETALVLNDLITAALLLGQFSALKMRGLLLLACGYAFTAATTIAHLLSFPGLFTPAGLIGGPQTTAWLFMFWHAGFPIFVIAYARSGRRTSLDSKMRVHSSMLRAVCLTFVGAMGLVILSTATGPLLPALMIGARYLPPMPFVVASVWLLSLTALLMLLPRRPHSVLDLWLIVVMCAWLFDIALSAGLNAGRFDLGFYAGRIYGLFAASFILLALLTRQGVLYAQLVMAHELERRLATELQRVSATDALTGVANRRAFEEALDSEWRRTLRYKTPLCLLMIDVDYFKRFNDAYGHVVGDDCLRRVAEAVASKARRAGELAARYGGEEFAILLPNVELAEAQQLAEWVCDSVRVLQIPHTNSAAADHVTVSIGVASATPAMKFEVRLDRGSANDNRPPLSPPPASLLVSNADRALYAAKAAGRNRVCVFDEGELRTKIHSVA
jgi:diguanylate cyclase (GGDEF)-like protein